MLTSSKIDAYGQALEGLLEGLDGVSRVGVIDLSAADAADRLAAVLQEKPPLVVAIGAQATRIMTSQATPPPFFTTMILRATNREPFAAQGKESAFVGSVSLDVPLSTVLGRLKAIFPGKTRLGVIRNPGGLAISEKQISREAHRRGFSVYIVRCDGPEKLVPTFIALKGKVDFVWGLPDASLYNATTIKPLILVSLRNRLPIIGFSAGFVRAGAAIGVYPDYREVGSQTASAVRRYLESGQSVGDLELEAVQTAVNQRVLRILGLRFKQPDADGHAVVVMR